jgi:4-amino-4-deoxy-L-arabinose transferase-like glycosyltransferase
LRITDPEIATLDTTQSLGEAKRINVFVLEFTYPRFPDMDHEAYFKAAGWNAIQKGAFAAPELEGYRHLDPPIERVYVTYPPLYTWLFGQWSRVTGFGWAACVGYDALISAVLAFIVYALAGVVADALLGPLSDSRRTALAFVPALLTLLFRQVARPDELGMALGLLTSTGCFCLVPGLSAERVLIVRHDAGFLYRDD